MTKLILIAQITAKLADNFKIGIAFTLLGFLVYWIWSCMAVSAEIDQEEEHNQARREMLRNSLKKLNGGEK